MSTINYRVADQNDQDRIALLHAASWQRHYRGIMSDEFLDHKVILDRSEVWKKRFKLMSPEMFIIVAESDDKLIGFVCTFLNQDSQYGSYLDNLHVLSEHQGTGIGKALMKQTAEWVHSKRPNSPLYLWVLEQNTQAINMYLHLGAQKSEKMKDPHQLDDGDLFVYRMFWRDVSKLL